MSSEDWEFTTEFTSIVTEVRMFYLCRDSNPPDLIGSLPIWCLASHSPDFYQILPIYYKILKTWEKLLIFRIFGDLSL